MFGSFEKKNDFGQGTENKGLNTLKALKKMGGAEGEILDTYLKGVRDLSIGRMIGDKRDSKDELLLKQQNDWAVQQLSEHDFTVSAEDLEQFAESLETQE